MRYGRIVQAEFVSRPNRFVAEVRLGSEVIAVHVKNTGRCRELLVPGAEVWLEDFTDRMGKRKMAYDIVAVRKGGLLINMDSQAPNKAVREALEDGTVVLPEMGRLTVIKPEATHGDSRFDFYVEDSGGARGFVEVKGVTLENGGIAAFPDAPTERGIKHLRGLVKAVEEGCFGYVLFVIQMAGMRYFTPNYATHAAFGEELKSAEERGVRILCYECAVEPDSMRLTKKVPVRLDKSGAMC